MTVRRRPWNLNAKNGASCEAYVEFAFEGMIRMIETRRDGVGNGGRVKPTVAQVHLHGEAMRKPRR